MTKRRTTSEHAVSGTQRPDRHRPRSPDVGGIGGPPGHLAPEVASVWWELAAALPPTVGSLHDRAAMELLARLVAKSRAGSVSAAEVAHLRGLFESFGLTPSGRQRLEVQEAPRPAKKAPKASAAKPAKPIKCPADYFDDD